MKTKAKQRADQKWEAKAYDKILIRLRKDSDLTREAIQEAATRAGLSLNAFIVEAVKRAIQGADDPGDQGSDPEEVERIPFYD